MTPTAPIVTCASPNSSAITSPQPRTAPSASAPSEEARDHLAAFGRRDADVLCDLLSDADRTKYGGRLPSADDVRSQARVALQTIRGDA